MTKTNKRYVVVEGPIGAGKSTLARRLAEYWGTALAAERPEDNPFLPRFYRDFQHHADFSILLSWNHHRSIGGVFVKPLFYPIAAGQEGKHQNC